ncbi:hypothetical protein FNV43_RR15706 [Rhamnella rubrinervis]|uniref:Uncharacterized protein n=1 Tax=Rhamnella rubrinervis TaxID=2594499 RepID=A0A8K0GXC4_9ROSA|nr:hypothetical protein FNV43_RR15706 [Rhamnella rubrinervis]
MGFSDSQKSLLFSSRRFHAAQQKESTGTERYRNNNRLGNVSGDGEPQHRLQVAAAVRAHDGYHYLMKLLLVGDSGQVSLPFLIDFKIRTIDYRGEWEAHQTANMGYCWPRTFSYNHNRGAMDIRNWIRNVEQHAPDNVNKILVGNKVDMDESQRAVPTLKGQELADEYGIKFFETSAKTGVNVMQIFCSIARDIKERLAESKSNNEPQAIKISKPDPAKGSTAAPEISTRCGS